MFWIGEEKLPYNGGGVEGGQVASKVGPER